ncbi:hypothetical protein HDU82_007256 [Entophlyctis luteolus]|nr:hypothetical protein HDU82_007256 [Entophlyctis luteolus]
MEGGTPSPLSASSAAQSPSLAPTLAHPPSNAVPLIVLNSDDDDRDFQQSEFSEATESPLISANAQHTSVEAADIGASAQSQEPDGEDFDGYEDEGDEDELLPFNQQHEPESGADSSDLNMPDSPRDEEESAFILGGDTPEDANLSVESHDDYDRISPPSDDDDNDSSLVEDSSEMAEVNSMDVDTTVSAAMVDTTDPSQSQTVPGREASDSFSAALTDERTQLEIEHSSSDPSLHPSAPDMIVRTPNDDLTSKLKEKLRALKSHSSISSSSIYSTSVDNTAPPSPSVLNAANPIPQSEVRAPGLTGVSADQSVTLTPDPSITANSATSTVMYGTIASTVATTASASIDAETTKRVLQAIHLPELEDTILLNGCKVSGFEKLLRRLDFVFNAKLSEIPDTLNESVVIARIGAAKLGVELEFERRAHEFETEIRKLKDSLSTASTKGPENVLQPITEMRQTSSESSNLKISLKESLDEIARLKTAVLNSEHENKNITIVLNAKIRESDSHQRTIANLRSDLEACRKEYRNLQDAYTATHTADSKLQLAHMSATQELTALRQANEWLTNQTERKTSEFSEYRSARTLEIAELQQALDRASQEKNANDSRAFRTEMATQKRLTEVFRQQVDELSGKYNENLEAIREAQSALEVMSDRLNVAEDNAAQLQNELEEKSALITELEKQLEAVNKSIEGTISNDLSVVSPAAQAALMLQKSGKSFTQIFVEYTKLQDENFIMNTEVERLKENLAEVLADINERAPILKQLGDDKKMLEENVVRLTESLAESEIVKAEAISFAKESKSQIEELTFKSESLEKECYDLGRQVQHLLYRLEMNQISAPQNRPLSPVLRKTDPSASSPSGRLISERLVLFENIGDLQSQNQQLRNSLRTVSTALKNLENDFAEQVEEKARKEIEEFLNVVAELREELRLAHTKCEGYIRERDELRLAAMANGPMEGAFINPRHEGEFLTSSRIFSRTSTPVNSQRFFDGSTSMSAQFLGNYEELQNLSAEETRRLREENESLSREKEELQIQAAKLQSAVDNANARVKSLQSDLDASKSDLQQYTSQISRLLQQISVGEANMKDLTRQVDECRHLLEEKTAEEKKLRSAKEALALREASLAAENNSLNQQFNTANEHLRRFQQIFEQAALDNKETVSRAEEKIQGLEGQMTLLRAQLTATQEDARKAGSRHELTISDSRFQIERLTAELAQAVREREIAKVEERRLSQHADDLTHRLSSAEMKIRELQDSIEISLASPEALQLQEMRSEVSRLRFELKTAQESLQLQKTHADQYKSIAESAEAKLAERLQEFNTTYDIFKTETEEKIELIEANRRKFEVASREAEAKLAEMTVAFEKEKATKSAEIELLSRKYADLAETVAQGELAEKMHQSTIQSLKDELAVQSNHLDESREAYERVVGAEAARIKTIASLKENLKSQGEELLRCKEQLLAIEGDFNSEKAVWETLKRQFEEQIAMLQKTNEDLSSQNKILHNQFEAISSRFANDAEETVPGSAEQLERDRIELINHLRRDKDALLKEVEVYKHSVKRLQKQVEQFQSLLNEARANLDAERNSRKSSGELEALQRELLSKIDRVNVLTESNSLLRQENSTMNRKISELTISLSTAESTNRPLKEQNSALLAEIDAFKAQVLSLEAENSKLIGRANEILGKYNRVDPAEHQSLKEKVAELEKKLETAQSDLLASIAQREEQISAYQSQIASLNAEMKNVKETLESENLKIREEIATVSSASMERELALKKMLEDAEAKGKNKVNQANQVIKGKTDTINELSGKLNELRETATRLEASNAHLLKESNVLEFQKLDIEASYEKLSAKYDELVRRMETEGVKSATSDSAIISEPQITPQIPASPSPASKRPREEQGTLDTPKVENVIQLAGGKRAKLLTETQDEPATDDKNQNNAENSSSLGPAVQISRPASVFQASSIPAASDAGANSTEKIANPSPVLPAEKIQLTNLLQRKLQALKGGDALLSSTIAGPSSPSTNATEETTATPAANRALPIPITPPVASQAVSASRQTPATVTTAPIRAVGPPIQIRPPRNNARPNVQVTHMQNLQGGRLRVRPQVSSPVGSVATSGQGNPTPIGPPAANSVAPKTPRPRIVPSQP